MKKSYLIYSTIIIVFSFHLSAFAQAPAVEWQTTIGGNKIDLMYAVQITSNGGCVIGGSSNSGLTGEKSQGSKGGFDYWIAKLDKSGSILWDKTYGGDDVDYLISITATSDGGFLLAGVSESGISGDKSQGKFGNYDYWIVKIDGSGNFQWDKTLGGNKGDFLNCVLQTKDGGYLLAGHSESGISGSKTESSRGFFDYWIVKTDASGNKLWDKTYGSTTSDYLYSVLQTSDGKYYLNGTSGSKAGADKTEDSKGGMDYWFLKLNEDGSKVWDKTIGGSGTDFAYAIKKVSSGGFMLGGYSDSNISGDKTADCNGLYDYWLVKVDQNGNVQWDKTIGGDDEDELYSLDQTSDGGFILGGYSESGISADKTEACRGDYDYWVVKTDGSGNVVWDKTLGGSGADELLSVRKTSDGKYVAAGYSYSNASGDKTENNTGGCDYWIVKLGGPEPPKAGNDMDAAETGEAFSIYPNPAAGQFRINFNQPVSDDAIVSIYDQNGKEVYAEKPDDQSIKNGQMILPGNKFSSGYYVVKIIDGEQSYSQAIVIEH